jgi:hypothetical protein
MKCSDERPSGAQLATVPIVSKAMHRITICAALIFGLLLATSSAEGRGRRGHPTCPYAGKHALVADAQAEVYEAEGRFERERFACAYTSGHAYALGPKPEGGPSGGGGVDNETLRGSIVAYEESLIHTEGSSRWTVIVRDLRTGRVLHRVASEGGFVEEFVLKTDGAVAWIVDTSYKPNEYAVVAADRTGTRMLATGAGIAPSSLALAGSTLYWTQDSRPVSAPLN